MKTDRRTAREPEDRGPAIVGPIYRYFAKATGGAPVFPIAALFFLFFFDEFDTAAFGVLAPDIRRTFDLTDNALGTIVILNLTVVLAAGVSVGYYADRLPRRLFVWVGALVAGTFSFLTGVAGNLALFILVRMGNGLGLLVNSGVHQSLLSDYYKPEQWPAVYSIHRNAALLGAVVGPAVAGGVAALFSWQAAFMILIVPIVTMGIIAMRLKEPLRGGSQDAKAAATAAAEKPAPFD